jgi:hypothetical protein
MPLSAPLRVLASFWLGGSLLVGAPARADERNLTFAGAALGGGETRVAIDDRVLTRSKATFYELEVGYLRAVAQTRLAVGGLVRFGTFADQWARAVGESRERLDLRLTSEVSVPFARSRIEQPAFTAALGFGPTVAWIRPPVRQVVMERYATGVGLHAALRLGIRVRLFGRSAGYYAAEGAIHRVSADRSVFVRGGSAHVVRERHRFEDYSFGAVLGFALSL